MVLFANAAFEDALGTSRRVIQGAHISHCFTEPLQMDAAMTVVIADHFATLLYVA